jgi:3-deoxy-D-manno-octulosonate 8-phosphate phosphatase (KDO 8-P phosphatase)
MITARLAAKIREVRLLILDVDGVLTDGVIVIDDAGQESKHFDVRDGHGLKMLMRHGVEVALLTGRRSAVVEHRARELGIAEVHQGAKHKLEVLEEILRRRELPAAAVGYVGDDVVDVPVLRRVGFAATVADAAQDIKSCVDYVTAKPGGRGAVREVCELILKAQDKWGDIAARYELHES